MAIRAPRPVLVFNHNPKAGGGTIRRVLEQAFTCELDPHVLTDPAGKRRDAVVRGGKGPTSCWVVVTEFKSSGSLAQQRGFVISSIREPCAHYLSLWSYATVNKKSGFRSGQHRKLKDLEDLYGKDTPFFNSSQDVTRFQRWMRHDKVTGLMMSRYNHNYLPTQKRFQVNGKKGFRVRDAREHVDCWVFVEDFESTFINCLREFEAQGGSVDWEAAKLKQIVEGAVVIAENKRQNDKNYTKNGNHGKCAAYFDAETAQMVEEGPDNLIYSKFGYSGCCSDVYNASIHPP